MKFDAVVGNPPYQEVGGKDNNKVMPLYQKFVEKSLELSKRYVVMITPTRWYNSKSNVHIKNLSDIMLKSGMLTDLVDYDFALNVFDEVDIAGGVCHFKLDKCNKNYIINFEDKLSGKKYKKDISKFDIIIKDDVAEQVISKVLSSEDRFISAGICGRSAFGIVNTQVGREEKKDGDITLISKLNTKTYINSDMVLRKRDLIDKYKVYCSYLGSDVNVKKNCFNHKVLSIVGIAKPQEVTTETYIILRSTDDIKEAENFISYITSRFVRFILLNTASSVQLTRNMYMYIPEQDFSKPWTDEELYKKYNISDDEIKYIETKVRAWENRDNN